MRRIGCIYSVQEGRITRQRRKIHPTVLNLQRFQKLFQKQRESPKYVQLDGQSKAKRRSAPLVSMCFGVNRTRGGIFQRDNKGTTAMQVISNVLQIQPPSDNWTWRALKDSLTKMLQAGMSLAGQDNLVQQRNNFSLSQGKMKYLRKQAKELNSNASLTVVGDGKDPILEPKTAADQLLAYYDQQENSCYVALFGEFDSDRLTIKKKCKFRQNHSLEEVADDVCQDSTSSAKLEATKMRDSIRNRLKVSDPSRSGGRDRILLAFAWTDTESKSRFDLFSDLLVADCVNFTNKEERPLLVFAGLDSNNHSFSHTWVFIPSEAKWAFRWVFANALPKLHKIETLAKVNLVMTDQDGQLNSVIDSYIGQRTFFPKALSRVCVWHKLNRNLTELLEVLAMYWEY